MAPVLNCLLAVYNSRTYPFHDVISPSTLGMASRTFCFKRRSSVVFCKLTCLELWSKVWLFMMHGSSPSLLSAPSFNFLSVHDAFPIHMHNRFLILLSSFLCPFDVSVFHTHVIELSIYSKPRLSRTRLSRLFAQLGQNPDNG